MRGVHIVGTWCFIVNIYFDSPNEALAHRDGDGSFVDGFVNPTQSTAPDEDNFAPSDDAFTYVAMLDIQFMDHTKKICSAAIIHDNVIITAAHCFLKKGSNPELTLSFIILGTEKMYETGYEHYVPIERYKYHPRFRGWAADLALVYTYTSLSGDNPGKVISLADDRLRNPIDTSIIVLSWGNITSTKKRKHIKIPRYGDPEENTEKTVIDDEPVIIDLKRIKGSAARKSEIQTLSPQQDKPYLRGRINSVSLSLPPQSVKIDDVTLHVRLNKDTANTTTERIQGDYVIKPHPRDWRRAFTSHKRKLTSEVFGLVNLQKCRQIIEASKPAMFILSDHDDFVCFSSEKHFITDDDMGAPLIRDGRLFGVTVGSVESDDGEHIAVGMRIPCFCKWIAENLPWGGDQLECCRDCCFPFATSPRPIPKQVVGFVDRRI